MPSRLKLKAWARCPRYTYVQIALVLFVLSSFVAPASAGWVTTWASSQQRVDPSIAPPPPGLANATLRQIVHTSVAGKRVRVRLTNEFGTRDLTIPAVCIAKSAGGSAVDPATNIALTFNGKPTVTIPAGAWVFSDAVAFDATAMGDIAVTIHFGDLPAEITMHPGARCTAFIQPGDTTSAVDFLNAVTTNHWYFLSGIDVDAEGDTPAVVAAMGDSITDGRGSTTDHNGRWTDFLARRLQADPATRSIGVVNDGIGGNRVLHDGLGPNVMARFDRDVLTPTGVRWLILLEGVNDLGTAPPAAQPAIAQALIDAYAQLITRSHAHGIKIFGGTILPFAGSQYSTPERESARQTVNTWIRTSGKFDAVVDFDAACRDAADPTHLAAAFDSGDHLHPADVGYQHMAEAIDLALFKK